MATFGQFNSGIEVALGPDKAGILLAGLVFVEVKVFAGNAIGEGIGIAISGIVEVHVKIGGANPAGLFIAKTELFGNGIRTIVLFAFAMIMIGHTHVEIVFKQTRKVSLGGV